MPDAAPAFDQQVINDVLGSMRLIVDHIYAKLKDAGVGVMNDMDNVVAPIKSKLAQQAKATAKGLAGRVAKLSASSGASLPLPSNPLPGNPSLPAGASVSAASRPVAGAAGPSGSLVGDAVSPLCNCYVVWTKDPTDPKPEYGVSSPTDWPVDQAQGAQPVAFYKSLQEGINAVIQHNAGGGFPPNTCTPSGGCSAGGSGGGSGTIPPCEPTLGDGLCPCGSWAIEYITAPAPGVLPLVACSLVPFPQSGNTMPFGAIFICQHQVPVGPGGVPCTGGGGGGGGGNQCLPPWKADTCGYWFTVRGANGKCNFDCTTDIGKVLSNPSWTVLGFWPDQATAQLEARICNGLPPPPGTPLPAPPWMPPAGCYGSGGGGGGGGGGSGSGCTPACPPPVINVPACPAPNINVNIAGTDVSVSQTQTQAQSQSQQQTQSQLQQLSNYVSVLIDNVNTNVFDPVLINNINLLLSQINEQTQTQTQAIINPGGGSGAGQQPVWFDQPGPFFFSDMDDTYRAKSLEFMGMDYLFGARSLLDIVQRGDRAGESGGDDVEVATWDDYQIAIG